MLGEDERLLTELVEVTRFLHAQGWTPATSSNFSCRRAPDRFWVSESGVDKAALTPAHFLEVDLAGRPGPEEHRRPSAETLLHAALYARYPALGCVLHTHSKHGTVLSMALAATTQKQERRRSLHLEGYEVLKGLAGIRSHEARVELPVFPNTQDMEALSSEVDAWLADEDAAGRRAWGYLITGHGLYAWGDTVAEAKRHLEVLEMLLYCELELGRIGVRHFGD